MHDVGNLSLASMLSTPEDIQWIMTAVSSLSRVTQTRGVPWTAVKSLKEVRSSHIFGDFISWGRYFVHWAAK